MVDGTHLWEFGIIDLGILFAIAAVYLLGGYIVFHYATRRARRLGVLGDY
jgi:ABC-2 type transport system permease protein